MPTNDPLSYLTDDQVIFLDQERERLGNDFNPANMSEEAILMLDEARQKARSTAEAKARPTDITTGIKNWAFRARYSRQDTPEEKKAMLDKTTGEGGHIQNMAGFDLITPEGLARLDIPNKEAMIAAGKNVSSISLVNTPGLIIFSAN